MHISYTDIVGLQNRCANSRAEAYRSYKEILMFVVAVSLLNLARK